MKRGLIQFATLALALLVAAGPSTAAESNAAGETRAITSAGNKGKAAETPRGQANVKLVDINSAAKAELKTLPGIGDVEADRIIAGRPYLSKANLVTAGILPSRTYEVLKSRVIARQNLATAAKVKEKQRGH